MKRKIQKKKEAMKLQVSGELKKPYENSHALDGSEYKVESIQNEFE